MAEGNRKCGHTKLDKYRDSYMDKTGQTPTVAFMPRKDFLVLL